MGINIKIDSKIVHKNEARYLLSEFCLFVGLQPDFDDTLPYHIIYGNDEYGRDKALRIPADNYADWQAKEPSLKWVDDIPVLYVNEFNAEKLFIQQDDSISLAFDIIAASFYALSRQEELVNKKRDQWGCFSGKYTIFKKLGILDLPFLNGYFLFLKDILERLYPGEFIFRPPWKDGKKFSVALIHDVDQPFKGDIQSGLTAIKRSLFFFPGFFQGVRLLSRGIFYSLLNKSDPYFNFSEYMELEARFNFKSSFNFVALTSKFHRTYDPAYKIENPRIINALEDIKRKEWGIGLHGSYYSADEQDVLNSEKISLERVLQHKISGGNQHYLKFEFHKTYLYQQNVGFSYDSSLGYNEEIGFRAGAAWPFSPYDFQAQHRLEVLIFPLVIMDGVIFRELKLTPDEAFERCKMILEKVKKLNGFAVILWHLRSLDKKDYPGYAQVYLRLLEYLSAEGAWVVSPNELANWWKDRRESLGV